MYIIVKHSDMPYYVGTTNGVISWSSDRRFAKTFTYWASAQNKRNELRKLTGDRSIRVKGGV